MTSYNATHDLAVLGELFTRYSHLTYGLALKYLKPAEAQDAVMDIFEKLPALLQKHTISNFKSWLYSVTKTHCLMHIRSNKNVVDYRNSENIPESSDSFMENEALSHQISEQELSLTKLEKGLKSLNKEQQECLELFYLKECSYDEVVDKTGYDLKKVKSYIQNGKRNLKMYMNTNSIGLISILLQLYYLIK